MKKIILTLVTVMFALSTYAQMGYYANQYMLNHQLINPAYSGKNLKVRGGLLANSHLTGIPSSPKSIGLNISAPIGLTKASLGLNVASFSMGVQSNTEVSAIYSYRLKFKKFTTVFGVQGTMTNMKNDGGQLETSVRDDDRFYKNTNGSGFNAGAGIYVFNKTSFLSISAPAWFQNTLQADGSVESDYNSDEMPTFVSVGHEGRLNKNWWLNPYVQLRHYMSGRNIMDINLICSYQNVVWAGPYYKTDSQYGIMVGAKLNKFLQFGYAGAISQQVRAGFTGSSHEISIIFMMKDKKVNTINSLRFF